MNAATRPNQHLVALATFIALLPLVYWVPDIIAPLLPANKLVNVIVVVGIIVPIISYAVMPLFIKCYNLHRQYACGR
tara:strand:+ start:169 stop:399 length:231 start_codon:yes stop_codon:yes gene_type:complete